MKKFASQSVILLAAWLGCACCASAQTVGPTATPSSLNFSYTVNSTTLPSATAVKITLPSSSSSLPLVVTPPDNWAAVTPLSGSTPLTLTVTVNPTGLAPGSYVTSISVDTNPTSHAPAVIPVTLTVSNLPPTLLVTSPQQGTYYTPPGSGSSSPIVTFSYTTGASTTTVPPPATAPSCNMELDVSSTGGIIPFNVTVANVKATSGTSGSSAVWVRVNSSGQLPTTATSGVANTGSYAPICVTADLPTLQTLNPGSYAGQITIAANNSANGTWVILVDLIVSAGLPVLNSIYPNTIVANPTVNPVFTLYGDNFFNTSVVTLQLGTNTPIGSPGVTTTLLSRGVLQATVNMTYFTPAYEGSTYPLAQAGPPAVPAGIQWTVSVNNPATPTNPQPQIASQALYVTDPTLPSITSVVNAASYLSTSSFTGTGTNPNPVGNPYPTTVAPREIISIFGQNLGPSAVTTATPLNTSGAASPPPLYYPVTLSAATGTNSSVSVAVFFTYTPPPTPPEIVGSPVTVPAPIIMFTSNQINVIVPFEVEQALQTSAQTATIQVLVTTTTAGVTGPAISTPALTVTVLPEDPGLFTFAGEGQGQAAVLNQDYSINGSKNAAARGSTIQVFVTGMGELDATPPQPDGMVATATPVLLADQTWRVDIGGQPAVVTYAGTSPGSVDGLVQINAIIPPTVGTGSSISITASIGTSDQSHRTQAGATICVK